MLYKKYRTTVFIHNANELENKRYDLMKAQIKPHFINNAMTAIQELCYEYPEKAAEHIDHFTRYLRNNIDMTGGTLDIDRRDGRTLVKITIPKEKRGKK